MQLLVKPIARLNVDSKAGCFSTCICKNNQLKLRYLAPRRHTMERGGASSAVVFCK